MPHSVSVPEKTLKHWSSPYITYRYRSKVALWWPARGEDIDFGRLPERPGKAVQLELKTTTVVGDGIHDLMVDLGQLWQYRQRPLGHQPFYAFPRPDSDWGGNLAAAAIAKGRAVTELGFARSGSGWWFADWMIVLTAAEVAAVLHKELAAHGSKKPKKERLVRFDHSKPGPVWGSGTHPAPVGWREFWPALEHCGRIGWPQLIRLPARLTRTRGPYPTSQVAEMLREAAEMPAGQGDTGEPLVTLEPDADGTFQVTLVPTDNAGRWRWGRAIETSRWVALVFRVLIGPRLLPGL
jgi:hypothetical protein